MQSAYRSGHSTETALLKVYNDILIALDKGQEVILVLLDYSAAFDTIDHETMIQRFSHRYGIEGTVLEWLKSYLANRKQIVVVNGVESEEYPLTWGVPQGSVMGPLEFVLYTGPLSDVIAAHEGITHMLYADDTQLYLVIRRDDLAGSISSMEDCVRDVKAWAGNNNLMLNGDKTELIHITSQFRKRNESVTLNIDGAVINATKSARDLGGIVDDTLDMKEHIRKVCRAATFGIYRIGKIRKYLNQSSTERLVNAFVTSHLDYCNSLLINLPASHLALLQHTQNTAARLITRTRKHDHITPVIHTLHWLLIPQRIQFKILLLTYNIIHHHAPSYLIELISPKQATRMNLRSSTRPQLALGPRTHNRYGDRAFSACAPLLWNNLPSHIQDSPTIDTFKKKLKTHLFAQQFQ